jgi:predicted DNA-binding protein with PD1-like motif
MSLLKAHLVSLLMLTASAASAQYAKLHNFVVIKVQDQSGAFVRDAEVRVVPVAAGGASALRTDQNGIAYLDAPPGRYEVTVVSPGFFSQRRTVEIASGTADTIVVQLHVASGGGVELMYDTISPSRPIPTGLAPNMQVKLVKSTKDEKVYAVIFHSGDEALSGLTDFTIQNHIVDAHFTAIGAISGATLGWLDLPNKNYRAIPVAEQVEVLSMIGDIATFNGKPVVHTHVVLSRHDGSTVGGHVWELHVNPTLEVFVTANATPLKKKPDNTSGMKFIDPTQ